MFAFDTGYRWSRTIYNVWVIVTVKLVEPSFPASSYAVHVTSVIPIGNMVPDAGVHVGPLVTATLSVAVTPV